MKTNNSKPDPSLIEKAAEIIMEGGIVCVPTDTVYGIICSASIPSAIERMAHIKKRPDDKPFALFTPSWERFAEEAVSPNTAAIRLAEKFWPGPLTLVVAAQDECPCVHQGAVGVRCPMDDIVQSILSQCGSLLANTSLNVSGEKPVWSLSGMHEFLDSFDLVIDCGVLPRKSSSTVVDCRKTPPAILREGIITQTDINRVVYIEHG